MRRSWILVAWMGLVIAGPAPGQEANDKRERPAVNAGRPTLTDPATLTAPGWLEVEAGIQRDLQQGLQLLTPVLFKLTGRDNRLEYRLQTDGYHWERDGEGGHVDGFGDCAVGLHYLLTRQDTHRWDTAARATIKLPTASARRGLGSGRVDYGLLLLASRDLSPGLHLDANVGYTALDRPTIGGYDNQAFVSVSTTMPIPHSRWSYTNELAYASAVAGSGDQLTMMHGVSYAVKPWDVWDVAVNFGLSRDTVGYQILFGRTFFLGRLF